LIRGREITSPKAREIPGTAILRTQLKYSLLQFSKIDLQCPPNQITALAWLNEKKKKEMSIFIGGEKKAIALERAKMSN